MDLLETKVVVLILWALLKMASGLLPVVVFRLLSKSKHGWIVDKVVGATLCVGGGVLLATVFLHLQPEVEVRLLLFLLVLLLLMGFFWRCLVHDFYYFCCCCRSCYCS